MLRMEGGGLEISDHNIKYLKLTRPDAKGVVETWGEEPLADGTIQGGDIQNADVLAEKLGVVRNRCGFSFAHVAIPELRGYLFDVVLPRAAQEDLRGAIELQLPEKAPLPAEEAIFDYELITADRESSAIAVAVTAFPTAVAQGYADALQRSGFTPLSFELEPQAAARAIVPRTAARVEGATLIVDFGAQRSILCIVSSGVPRFTTSFDGTAKLDALILKDRTREEMRVLKQEEGLASADPAIAEMFVGGIAGACSELKRHIVYWNSRGAQEQTSDRISSVIVYGGNANIRGLPEYLARALSVPASVADVWRNALPAGHVEVPPIPRIESYRYATPVGLAMRSRGAELW